MVPCIVLWGIPNQSKTLKEVTLVEGTEFRHMKSQPALDCLKARRRGCRQGAGGVLRVQRKSECSSCCRRPTQKVRFDVDLGVGVGERGEDVQGSGCTSVKAWRQDPVCHKAVWAAGKSGRQMR